MAGPFHHLRCTGGGLAIRTCRKSWQSFSYPAGGKHYDQHHSGRFLIPPVYAGGAKVGLPKIPSGFTMLSNEQTNLVYVLNGPIINLFGSAQLNQSTRPSLLIRKVISMSPTAAIIGIAQVFSRALLGLSGVPLARRAPERWPINSPSASPSMQPIKLFVADTGN